MKKAFFLSLIAVFCAGCFSTKPTPLNISSVYPFEGRYDSSNTIKIDDDKISFNKEDSVWILSNHTLYNLLTAVSDNKDKITFGNKKTYVFSKDGSFIEYKRDAFDDEEYVWENWIVPTNGVR